MSKEFFMQQAYLLAQKAAEQDEVPVGAVIVEHDSGEIIAKAYNQTEHSGNALQHAEMLAIRQACEKLGSNRLRGMDLYVTLEPCTMCAAAISLARIENLYFGAEDKKGGAVVNGVRFYDSPTCHHRPQIESGILEEQCAQILKDFFKAKRK